MGMFLGNKAALVCFQFDDVGVRILAARGAVDGEGVVGVAIRIPSYQPRRV